MGKHDPCDHPLNWERQRIFADGTKHQELVCRVCGAHLKFISHKTADEHEIHFGKYAGMRLVSVVKIDRPYANWLYENRVLKGSQHLALIELLNRK